MSLSLYALTCGYIEGEFGRLMEGGEGKITVPIPVFLIDHPKGRALFDTGLHPDCQHDAAGRLGERMTNLFKITFRAGEEVSAQLEQITAILTAGMLPTVPIAQSRAECRSGPVTDAEGEAIQRAVGHAVGLYRVVLEGLGVNPFPACRAMRRRQ